ncbi:MAG: hypothetical protein CMJ70_05770 [Planctomycetaceae bacterium]|nr:hypothetical protein [Planctomycetaceae bacterium]HAA69864.1 hypothetical protein [Planctomycetaceae bacterium]
MWRKTKCLPSDEHRRCTPSGGKPEFCDKNFLQSRVTDLFVPEDPERRFPDEFVVALFSGLFLFQESGAGTIGHQMRADYEVLIAFCDGKCV